MNDLMNGTRILAVACEKVFSDFGLGGGHRKSDEKLKFQILIHVARSLLKVSEIEESGVPMKTAD